MPFQMYVALEVHYKYYAILYYVILYNTIPYQHYTIGRALALCPGIPVVL